jgi:hypothetical protein
MNSLANSEKNLEMSSKTLSAPQDMASITSQSQKLAPLPPSVPLTPSETASLRKVMSEAMDWMETQLVKDIK